MDLFGDLPSLQSSKSGNDEKNCNDETKKKKTPPTNETSISKKKNKPTKNSVQIMFTPRLINKNNQNNNCSTNSNTSRGASVVSNLGNVGTTMAFMPSALRKKKTTGTGAAPQQQSKSKISTATNINVNADNNSNNNHDNEKGLNSESLKKVSSFASKIENASIHSTSTNEQNNQQINKQEQQNKLTVPEPEIEEEDIIDPYNPLQPNDYLLYRQQKKQERQNKELKLRTEETLKLQQAVRKRIEEERKIANATGDVDQIISLREKQQQRLENESGGIGRGRGRGVSNLPAWVLKRQQEQKRELNS